MIISGIWFSFYWQNKIDQDKKSLMPQNIEIVNQTTNTTGFIWQTNKKSIGSIIFSTSKNLNNPINILSELTKIPFNTPILDIFDVRDLVKKEERNTHFVIMSNLQPDTNYFYKIYANNFGFPDSPSNIKTPELPRNRPFISNQPIRGTVIDENKNPVANAIVKLKIKGASPLANFTGQTGNFIITTDDIRTENLSQFYEIQNGDLASLTIYYDDKKSEFLIKLTDKPQLLPPLVTGQNIDLTNYEASSTPNINWESGSINYDLNNDGVINSLDRAIVNQNFGPSTENQNVDFNRDGVVDETDLELITRAIK